MYNYIRHTVQVFLLAFWSIGSLYAADFSLLKNVEISGAGGVNWLNTKNTHFVVTPEETDGVRIDNSSSHGTWKFGAGYYFFHNHLLIELNAYGGSNTARGDVWQFEDPEFSNYRFSAPFSSTRLMLDFKPNLITWQNLTPYLILGVGAAWNTVSYEETANPGISPITALHMSEKTRTQLAWDVGAGISYALTEEFSFTVEYVYGFLGEATPQHNKSTIDAPDFSYQIQTLLLGVSIKL